MKEGTYIKTSDHFIFKNEGLCNLIGMSLLLYDVCDNEYILFFFFFFFLFIQASFFL
jgi:hypothetical protein